LALLGLVSIPLFFIDLGTRDLWSSHEARAAQNAKSILNSGRWGVPRLYDGRLELQKPPLFYWLVAGTACLRGGAVDAWDVRLPAGLAALCGAITLLVFCRRLGRPGLGVLAGLILATLLHYTWLARVGRIDMPLTLATTLALTGYYVSCQTGSRLAALLGYLGIALGVLLKGPIGIVLPAVVIGSHLVGEWWNRPQTVLERTQVLFTLAWGIPLILLVTVPYFWWLDMQTDGQFWRVFFLHHNLDRGLGADDELEAHPWWLYALRIWPDLFPWSLFLPVAGWHLWRGGWRNDPLARFGCLWFLVITLFLSCMSFKRADYLLPAYPGAALLLGCALTRWGKWTKVAVVGMALACASGWLIQTHILLPQSEALREQRTFALEVRQRVPAPTPVLLFRTEAHQLIFHLGPPVDRLIEWENLDIWLCRPEPIYVVMPPECYAEWEQRLEAGRLHWVVSNSELAGATHEEPLVLLSNQPEPRTKR
jgi:4-amino-4-deoxy-L-arabinose transferase-like glycosyltransferase